MFQAMINSVKEEVANLMYRVNIVQEEQQPLEDHLQTATASHGDTAEETKKKPVVNKETVGRNDPCPCGSGKKYKNCCGRDK